MRARGSARRPARSPARAAGQQSAQRAAQKAERRARPGGKPRSAASGAATGVSGARSRRPHLTGRAAILAVVVCAIVLSLAYPVREYVAQRREIAQLRAEAQRTRAEIAELQERKRRLSDPDYIERQARSRLQFCMPGETCYVVVDRDDGGAGRRQGPTRPRAWYETLWRSVEAADQPSGEAGPGR